MYDSFTLLTMIISDKAFTKLEKDDPYAPVGHYIIESFHLQDKLLFEPVIVKTPSTLQVWVAPLQAALDVMDEQIYVLLENALQVSHVTSKDGNYMYLFAKYEKHVANSTIYQQTAVMMNAIQSLLSNNKFQMSQAIHNVVVIQDMKQFAEMNRAYCTFYSHLPPSRYIAL